MFFLVLFCVYTPRAKVFYTILKIVSSMKAYEFEFPDDLYYMKNHVWLKNENGQISIGITELGQSLSKGIVHIDLPEIGESIKKGDMLVAYETIKAVSQISLPFDSKIISVNEKLMEDPNIINSDPYVEWIVKVNGLFSAGLVMKVEEAIEYYEQLIAKERERYADN
jgi:glycine cleavage system H protein